LKVLRKKVKYLSKDSRIPSRDLNLESPEYEASQTTNPQHSVCLCIQYGLQFLFRKLLMFCLLKH